MYNTLVSCRASALATADRWSPFPSPAFLRVLERQAGAATSALSSPTGPGGRVTQHSFGDNSYASRTVGPGYTSTRAMAGCPGVGPTTVRRACVCRSRPSSGACSASRCRRSRDCDCVQRTDGCSRSRPSSGACSASRCRRPRLRLPMPAQTGVAGAGAPLSMVAHHSTLLLPEQWALLKPSQCCCWCCPRHRWHVRHCTLAFNTPATEAAQARARASANTAAGGALPVGGPLCSSCQCGRRRTPLSRTRRTHLFSATRTTAARGGWQTDPTKSKKDRDRRPQPEEGAGLVLCGAVGSFSDISVIRWYLNDGGVMLHQL